MLEAEQELFGLLDSFIFKKNFPYKIFPSNSTLEDVVVAVEV